MEDKILVIGGTGNIGFPLIEYLNQKNVEVVAGTHNVDKAAIKLAGLDNVEIRYFDFLDPESFENAMTGVNKVFFVRPPQLEKPKQDMLPFLTYIKQEQIQQLVFISLLGVEALPFMPHHTIEKMILNLNVPYTFIRPNYFMQNLNTTNQKDIYNDHDLFIPGGSSRTSFVDTRDVGEIAGITLLNNEYINQKIDITGPESLTYQEIAQIMSKILGVDYKYSRPSLLKFRKAMLQRGINKDFVNTLLTIYVIEQVGTLTAMKVNDNAKNILGHSPRNIQTYIEDYQKYFK
ncbi:NmrA family NAD(P)-binding protein [Companilactobacillus hulinensis]|uniref:NmrA family NAD(P)-binding protein n=1 Tax=Companilactobacillus hulinensis TaxID=2486007 RepID=UPI000F776041|nr:NmrA family NAD(P)-binding protein [Companilactobacillus hulinensis]